MEKFQYKISAAGRVNIIGEHIDYCGGKVMPAALSLKNTVYIRFNNSNKINLKWTTLKDSVSFDLDKLSEYKNLKYGSYQAGCAYILKEAGYDIKGVDMLQDSTVPFGSGLSSSAAIEVSTIASLLTINGYQFDKREIALLAQKVERDYVGVNCGIMDQYASANGKKNNAILLDCKKISHEYVPFDLGSYALVIANCNKPHNLMESKYNERRQETELALEIVKKVDKNISCLADLNLSSLETFKSKMPPVIYKRFYHVITEVDRVKKAQKALQEQDILILGKLLTASHASLRDYYEVTGKELDTLQAIALSLKGCIGARMTGAGFGGCVISLVDKGALLDFKAQLAMLYKKEIGYDCSIYDTTIEDGIVIEKL